MGSIVGGLYATGMTPDELEAALRRHEERLRTPPSVTATPVRATPMPVIVATPVAPEKPPTRLPGPRHPARQSEE